MFERLVVGMVVTLAACAQLDDEAVDEVCFPDQKCDSITDSGGVVPTDDRSADVLGGFNVLNRRATPTCVRPVTQPAYLAGQASESVDVVYLENRSSLSVETSTALGVALDLGIVEVSALHELLSTASTSATSINLLVRMRADYWVMQRNPLALESWAAAKLNTGIGEFVKTCGTHYAAGARFGGFVYVLATFDANDTQTIQTVKTNLGLKLNTIVPLTTTLSTRVTTVVQTQNVSVTLRFAAEGFMLDGRAASVPLISTLLGTGIGPEFFTALDHVREQLEQSVNDDKCRDGGVGTCAGRPSPGFAENSLRNGRPTGILAGYYDRVSRGVPANTAGRWSAMGERVEQTASYLRSLKGLEDQLDTVYATEISRALAYGRWEQLQVVPPAAPLNNATQVMDVVKTWERKLGPDGAVRQPIRDAAQACFDASADLSQCAGSTEPVAESALAKAVDAELASYKATGRVLPIKTTSITPSGVPWNGFCSEGRWPDDVEARFMAPLIASSRLSDHRIWTYTFARCGSDSNAFTATDSVAYPICITRGWFSTESIARICVPSTGPISSSWD